MKKLAIREVEELKTTAGLGMAVWAVHGLESGWDWAQLIKGVGNCHKTA